MSPNSLNLAIGLPAAGKVSDPILQSIKFIGSEKIPTFDTNLQSQKTVLVNFSFSPQF